MIIEKHKIEFEYAIAKFESHKIIKTELLRLIDQSQFSSLKTETDNISKYDWDIPSHIKRPYIDFFINNVGPLLIETLKNLNHSLIHGEYTIQNHWFQQYVTNDKHAIHNHGGSSYACVYYVELPENGPKTVLVEPHTGKEIIPEVSEGDLLVFPAITWHYSPANKSSERKTVIAFNVI